MKLQEALAFVLPIGLHKGQTLGWVAKHTPGGLAYISKLYESHRLRDETREAIRSFLAAPKMQQSLGKAMREHRQGMYLLPTNHPGCPACGERMHSRETLHRCQHDAIITLQVIQKCECGVMIDKMVPQQRCSFCEDMPLFRKT